jgi:hypothetical protein
MKQTDLFGEEVKADEGYTTKIEIPIYEPKNKKPYVLELLDDSKTKRLINEIENAEICDEDKKFLIEAARRHTVFNYAKIADYYANSPKEVQELMERSALVIIDFEKAIQLGYVKLSQDVFNAYLSDKDEK